MVQTLEAIRGGGGSVKIGTTGTISALMSREIESAKSTTKAPSTCNPSSGEITPRKLKSRTSVEEASSSNTNTLKNEKLPEAVRKNKHHSGRTNQIPMLAADNMSLEGTPIRQKPVKKGPSVVEIVNIKCGNADKAWVNPIANRLKKLGFSKLSDNTG